jgi:tetratricopeptide (TPR) repeat protein
MEELRQDGLAVQGFQKAAAAAPGIELRAEALERAARIETRRRRYREAVALYAEIARIQPAGPRGRAALLESARLSIGSLRDPAGALAVYERLLATPGLAADQRARVQLGIAGARLRLGDLEKAEQALRSIVSPPADPDDAAEALYRLAEISFFRLDFRTASERYEEAATTYPHSAHANDAIERYVLLFQGEDDANGEPLRLLAALEQAVGKGDLAAATLASDEMAARHPDSILMDDALLALGSAYEEADSVGVAIRTYREIPARFPESRLAPEAQKRIGDLYAGALGDFKQALVEYEALLTRWPMSLQAGEMRGTVLRLRRKNAS